MSQIAFVDFETYYSSDFSLSRMTTREYITDNRFEVIGASIAIDGGEPSWYDAPDLPLIFKTIDWSDTFFCAHNTMFDGAIMKWRYCIQPKFWYDTMGMAQALLAAVAGGASLKAVSQLLGMHKDSQALMNMRGKRFADTDRNDASWQRYKTYANEDVNMSREIFYRLRSVFPEKELVVIDTLLRMYFDNKLRIDREIVQSSLDEVRAEAKAALARAGVSSKSQLRSRGDFARLLLNCGVQPPTKISPATGEKTYAFSKNDIEFAKLLEHDNPRVRFLVEAKINASSTIEESRAERFERLSRIEDGVLNAPLRYSAAHTHRFGGSDKLNLQNLPRKSPLRKAIVAPEGYKIVVVDASQIEARMLAWMAKETQITDAFARGEDVYSSFATRIYGYEVDKNKAPDERFVGKTGILGLGYGTGKDKFQWSLLTSPFYFGEAPIDFCENVVNTYRTGYPRIPQFWKRCDELLGVMSRGGEDTLGPLKFSNRRVLLPSGLPILYPQLHWKDAEEWADRGYQYYSARYKGFKKIYGAALTENLIQALSRIVITDAMLYMRMTDPDYFCALQVHDELVYLVPEAKAEACYQHLMKYMTTIPSWADETLPLAAEGGIGNRYSEIK
jgi:hypothetical protein